MIQMVKIGPELTMIPYTMVALLYLSNEAFEGETGVCHWGIRIL